MRLNLPPYVYIAGVGAPIWLAIVEANPIAGAFFGGLLMAGPFIVSALTRRNGPDNGGGGGGGGWDDPQPGPSGPGGFGRDVTNLTADELIASWATTPAEKEKQS